MSPLVASTAAGSARALGDFRPGANPPGMGSPFSSTYVAWNSSTASSTTLAATFTSAVSVGTTLIGVTKSSSGTATLPSAISDTKGNSYTLDVFTINAGANCTLFSAKITTALTTSDTITITYGSTNTTNKSFIVMAYAGVWQYSTSRLDQTTSASSGTAAFSSSTLTLPKTSGRGELLVSGIATALTQATLGGSSTYISTYLYNFNSAGSVTWDWYYSLPSTNKPFYAAMQATIIGSPSQPTASWTWLTNSSGWASVLATYYPA